MSLTTQIPSGTVLFTEATDANVNKAASTAGITRVHPDSTMTLNSLVVSGALALEVTTGLVAKAGGGQASATQLNSGMNVLATVATDADSVKLPAGTRGEVVYLFNGGAKSAQVYTSAAGFINGVNGVTTGVAQASGTNSALCCIAANNYVRIQGA